MRFPNRAWLQNSVGWPLGLSYCWNAKCSPEGWSLVHKRAPVEPRRWKRTGLRWRTMQMGTSTSKRQTGTLVQLTATEPRPRITSQRGSKERLVDVMSLRKSLGERQRGEVSSKRDLPASQAGQSLIETALILPFLLWLAFDAINFGYFFYAAVNVASAPRAGAEWSIIGPNTPSNQANYPPAGPATDITSVTFLTYEDMRGAIPLSSNAKIQVCTTSLGINPTGANTSSQVPNCCVSSSSSGSCSAGATWSPTPDPEAPLFVLQRVDVAYKVNPLIPQFSIPTKGGTLTLSLLPGLTVHRQVSMRAM
jgi:Flp pilus assembly protein TadG